MMNTSSDEDEIDTKRALRLFGKGRRQYGAATYQKPKLTHSSREGRIPFPWPRHTNTKEVLSEYFGKSGVSKFMEIPAHLLESDSDDDDLANSSGLATPNLSSTPPLSPTPPRNLSPPPLLSSSDAKPPSLSLDAYTYPDSKDGHPLIGDETVDIYRKVNDKYKQAVDLILEEYEFEKYFARVRNDPDDAKEEIAKSFEKKLDNLKQEAQHELEDELAEAAVNLPEPKKEKQAPSLTDPYVQRMKRQYPSIFSESQNQVLTPDQEENKLEQRLSSLYETEEQAKERKAREMSRSPQFEPKEVSEHRKAEAKRIDTEAAAQLAKEDALNKLKDTKPMLRLETIVYRAKNSASIEKQVDTLIQDYLSSNALQSLYMAEIPKRYQSKEGWRQFKEDVRAKFGRRKIELIAEKDKSNISAFPYSSDEESSDSDEEVEQSPKTPKRSTTRSVEIAKKFGEVTPAAASRAGDASAEPESDNDDIEEYLDAESEEEEKDFDPSTKTFKPVTEVLDASRVALTKHGKLGLKQRIEILEDLQVAIGKLKESERIKSVSFMQDGTLKYHGGNTSTFELRDKVRSKLKELRKGGGPKGTLK